jgi:ABC-2 type transport system permease protein
MSKVLSLSLAMWKAYARQRSAVFFTVFFPLMFLVLFGGIFKNPGAAKLDVLEVGSVAVLDQAPPTAQADLAKVLKITRLDDAAAAQNKVRKGDYAAAIEQQGGAVVVHYSAADAVKSGMVQSVMQAVVNSGNQASSGAPPRYSLRAEQVEDKSLKSIQFYLPGLLGWALAMGGMFTAALTLVTWRDKQLLRRLRLAPTTTATVLGARMLVSVVVALLQTVIFIGVASIPYFGLQLTHDWWMGVPLVIAGTLAFLSFGLVVGAFAKTEEAANGLVQLIVMPMAFLSGAFFPLDGAPGWLQAISRAMPLRYLVEAMRDVMVRGKDWTSVLPVLGALVLFAVVVSAFASRLFRWDTV